MGRAVAVVLIIGLAGVARAQSALYDLPGARSAATGDAQRASGLGNEAIWLNPAALSETQRYTVTLDGSYELRGDGALAGVSVVDSTTTPVAAGIAAHRIWVGPSGARTAANVFDVGISSPLGEFVSVGAGGKLIHTREGDGAHNRLSPDISLFVKAAPVNVGLVAYNIVNPVAGLNPRQYAVAASLAMPRLPKVEADVVFDSTTKSDVAMAYHFGADYELIPLLALRAGYLEDRISDQRTVSGGIGLTVPPGFGMELAYRHELLGAQPARELILGINIGI